jgi:hypothetical protein
MKRVNLTRKYPKIFSIHIGELPLYIHAFSDLGILPDFLVGFFQKTQIRIFSSSLSLPYVLCKIFF